MIHHSEAVPDKIQIKQPGISIKKIYQPENKHYLFVDLDILPTAKSGMYDLVFPDGKTIQYE